MIEMPLTLISNKLFSHYAQGQGFHFSINEESVFHHIMEVLGWWQLYRRHPVVEHSLGLGLTVLGRFSITSPSPAFSVWSLCSKSSFCEVCPSQKGADVFFSVFSLQCLANERITDWHIWACPEQPFLQPLTWAEWWPETGVVFDTVLFWHWAVLTITDKVVEDDLAATFFTF